MKNNTNEENEYIFLIKILKTLDFISQNNVLILKVEIDILQINPCILLNNEEK